VSSGLKYNRRSEYTARFAAREANVLPVGYFHVVFTLPAEIADIALQNKAIVYDLLFSGASETMMTIAADPCTSAPASASPPCSTLGESAMTHHPHIRRRNLPL
jgi:hypothetical protein